MSRSRRSASVVSEENFGQYHGWTLVALQSELRQRGLPVSGRKQELLHRLLQADIDSTSEKSPSKSKSRSRNRSPSISRRKSSQKDEAEEKLFSSRLSSLTLFQSPVLTLYYFGIYVLEQLTAAMVYLVHHRTVLVSLFTLSFIWLIGRSSEGPHSQFLTLFESEFQWYFRWVMLGVASSIGLGTGAHTFVLFLGPFIAKVTRAAYVCNSTAFDTRNIEELICPSENSAVTLWTVLDMVKWECFAWGAGTALGEIPPYFISRASALAGQENSDLLEIESIRSKPLKDRTISDRLHIIMYNMVQYLGFWGILLCASVPNPLFDLAGITCGYFLVPFFTFFGATLVGKAVFKSIFVVSAFAGDTVDRILEVLTPHVPAVAALVRKWLDRQRDSFTGSEPIVVQEAEKSIVFHALKFGWDAFIPLMIAFFVVSIVHSLAAVAMKQERDRLRKKNKE